MLHMLASLSQPNRSGVESDLNPRAFFLRAYWLRAIGYEGNNHANKVMISQLVFLCRLDIFVKIEPKYV